MTTTSPPPEQRRLADGGRTFYPLGFAVLVGFVAWIGRGVLIPLVVAGFVSFLIFTLKEQMRAIPFVGKRLPNWLCFLLSFLTIGGVFLILLDIIRDNVGAVVAAAPAYETRLESLARAAIAALEQSGAMPKDLMGVVEELQAVAISAITPMLRSVGSALRAVAANSVTIFLYTVFILVERSRIFRKIELLSADAAQREAVDRTIGEIGRMVRQYITFKTATNFITASLSFIILLALDIDFAGFWALMIFLLNFVPIVGSIVAVSGPVLLALVQPEGGGVQTALLALALLVGAEQLMSTVVEPRLIGASLNLSPLIILVSLGVWGGLWGFAGMLLAVPMTVTTMIILAQFRRTRPLAILLSDNGQIAALSPHLEEANAELQRA
jgi:predicted PurR-regulated permease PerM